MESVVILKAETALWTGGNRRVMSSPLINLQPWPSRPIVAMPHTLPTTKRA